MKRSDNPFLRYGLDPSDDLARITERLRELAEDATDPDERDAIRAAWDALTKSPARRFELALEVCPAPPPLPPLPRRSLKGERFEPRLADLLTPGPLAERLAPPDAAERRAMRVNLGFLRRDDEARATGPIAHGTSAHGETAQGSARRGHGPERSPREPIHRDGETGKGKR